MTVTLQLSSTHFSPVGFTLLSHQPCQQPLQSVHLFEVTAVKKMRPCGIPDVCPRVTLGIYRPLFLLHFLIRAPRFQVVVLSAYKQIRAQHMNVLSDIDEDNYDRAFAFLRPSMHPTLYVQHFALIPFCSNPGCI